MIVASGCSLSGVMIVPPYRAAVLGAVERGWRGEVEIHYGTRTARGRRAGSRQRAADVENQDVLIALREEEQVGDVGVRIRQINGSAWSDANAPIGARNSETGIVMAEMAQRARRFMEITPLGCIFAEVASTSK